MTTGEDVGNWLLTSASAKVDITCRLQAALKPYGLKLYTTDCSPHCAAAHFSDGHFELPPTSVREYAPELVKACLARDIRTILPTRDDDALALSRLADDLRQTGILVLTPPAESVALCLDKIRFYEHCLAQGLPVIRRITSPTSSDYPCFVRSRHASAGKGAEYVKSEAELRARHGPPPWPDLLMQAVCRDQEYTIDALFDMNGVPVQWISRERLLVKAGESVVSRTVSCPALDSLMPAIAHAMRLVGPVTIQAFHDDAQGASLIEINPRIGGAAALGIEAGLDTPRRLVALAHGDMPAFREEQPLQFGLTMLRYSRDIFLKDM